jgi:hypothetical protein
LYIYSEALEVINAMAVWSSTIMLAMLSLAIAVGGNGVIGACDGLNKRSDRQ